MKLIPGVYENLISESLQDYYDRGIYLITMVVNEEERSKYFIPPNTAATRTTISRPVRSRTWLQKKYDK